MGIEVAVEGLTKTFGRHVVWRDVSLSLPAGEVSVMLGPSGTGKTVFLKSLVGLVRPDQGRVLVDGIDTVSCSERQLYRARKLFGVMFQDGALFGSLNLYDNVAFPLREHTKLTEAQIRSTVLAKMDMVGLAGEGHKYPAEISGGMRKRAGLARALVLDPQIILCDEPDSGLDPVRTAYLSQLLIDLNAKTDATILIVTHDIQIARTVPDNIGMLFRGSLVMFGPREVLLTSEHPVITQFVNGRRTGPIGMSEEKDEATLAQEAVLPGGQDATAGNGAIGIVPQLEPSPGLPGRPAVQRRTERVLDLLPTLSAAAQAAILASLGGRQHSFPEGSGPAAEQPSQTAELPGAQRPERPGGRPAGAGGLAAGAGGLAAGAGGLAAGTGGLAAGTGAGQPSGTTRDEDTEKRPEQGPGSWPSGWPGGPR